MDKKTKLKEHLLKRTTIVLAMQFMMDCVLLSSCYKANDVGVPVAAIDKMEYPNDRKTPNVETPIEFGKNNIEGIIGIWEYPGGEANPMQIIFHEDGSLEFKDGFEFYNPAKWTYEINKYELSLFLPKLELEKMETFLYLLEKEYIKRIDRVKKEIVYDLSPDTRVINFAGWNFRKK